MSDDVSIIFSRHALMKLDQRNLTKEMVIKVIQRPARLMVVGDKMHAFGRLQKLYLKVIFTRTKNSIIIITQHIVKKLP